MSTTFAAEIELGPQSIDRSRRWNVLRFCTAAVLLTAAGLKTYQLATTPSLGDGLLDARWLNILVVEFELGFGVWLIFGMLPKTTWLASLACFTAFAGVSFYKGMIGADSCGCFGAVAVNPWYTFMLDACIVAALIACRPNGISLRIRVFLSELTAERRWKQLASVMIGWLLLAVPATAVMMSVSANSLAELGTEFTGADGRKTILLEPEKWKGKEFPLLPYIEPPEVREPLKTGEWTVVLYHHDCPKCKETISDLASKGTQNVVCVEMPPYGEATLPSGVIHAKLIAGADGYDWFAETPVVTTISTI